MLSSAIWIFNIWMLFAFESGLGSDELCKKDSFSACASPNTFPLEFPENESQLDESCFIVTQYMPCVRNHEISCHGSFKHEEQYNKVFGTVTTICKEDSFLHETLGKNLRCIKKVLNKHNETCFEERERVIEAYMMYLKTEPGREYQNLTSEEWDVVYCLDHSFNIGCFLRNVLECGTEAKDISIQIIKSSGFILDGCPDDIRRTANLLFGYLELQYYEEILIRDVFLLSEQN